MLSISGVRCKIDDIRSFVSIRRMTIRLTAAAFQVWPDLFCNFEFEALYLEDLVSSIVEQRVMDKTLYQRKDK